jgi:hypothetical protein
MSRRRCHGGLYTIAGSQSLITRSRPRAISLVRRPRSRRDKALPCRFVKEAGGTAMAPGPDALLDEKGKIDLIWRECESPVDAEYFTKPR